MTKGVGENVQKAINTTEVIVTPRQYVKRRDKTNMDRFGAMWFEKPNWRDAHENRLKSEGVLLPLSPRFRHLLSQRRTVQRFQQLECTQQIFRHAHARAIIIKLCKIFEYIPADRSPKLPPQ
jgi:hypothetical protein